MGHRTRGSRLQTWGGLALAGLVGVALMASSSASGNAIPSEGRDGAGPGRAVPTAAGEGGQSADTRPPGRPSAGAQPAGVRLRVVEGGHGLSGQVIDGATGETLPARVVVRDAAGQVVSTRYEHLPGIFTEEDATFELDLGPGEYALEVHHGIDYVSQRQAFEVTEGAGVEARIALEPWVPLRALGWVNGDGHAHLYTDEKPDDPMLETVRRICRAQGVDFLAVCQGWAGYGDDDWREGYAAFSDEHFLLHYGAEMPKYRTGHTFWFGLESTRGYYAESMDRTYEDEYYQVSRNPEWSFETLPFPAIPDVELVPRLKQAENAVAVVPHPTSWWWQKRDDVEKYTTNVGSHLTFGLLSGGLWDALVVMGYDHDHYFYQNLWFHILNEGYRMTPVAELDAGLEPHTRFYYGSMRTYLKVGPETSMVQVVEAVKAGRTLVTSGPIVLAHVDDRYEVGDVVPADGADHTLRIQAFASGDPDDHLTYLILFRNGRIHRLWDLRDQRPRRLEEEVTLRESERAWYVLKAYGRNADRSPEALDVMAVCDGIIAGRSDVALPKESDVALTSPFYFRPEGVGDPAALEAHVRLTVVDPGSGMPVGKGSVHVQLLGQTVARHELNDGRVELTMPVNALLVLDVPGSPTLRRSLYLDYPPYRDLMERLATGRWLDAYGGKARLQPGQVPWEAFHFDEARATLRDVEWTIPLSANERDSLWERFEGLFGTRGVDRTTGGE